MKSFDFGRFALSMGVGVAMLAACGGSQPSISTPGAMPQGAPGAQAARHASSSASDLLYVSSIGSHQEVFVFSYPSGSQLRKLSGFQGVAGLCSDLSGNVFVVDGQAGTITKYAHGGTTPIATLDDSGNEPNGCAVDPTTNNLAVAGYLGTLAIFPGEQGPPTIFANAGGRWCAYDDSGDLFLLVPAQGRSASLSELPASGSTFSTISVNHSFGGFGDLQWVNGRLALEDSDAAKHGHNTIYQVSISGTTGTIVRTIKLSTGDAHNPGGSLQFAVVANRVLIPLSPRENVGSWRYPKGGKVLNVFESVPQPYGVTVSVAPSH